MRFVTLLAAAGLAYGAYSFLFSTPRRGAAMRHRLSPQSSSGSGRSPDAGSGNFVRNAGPENIPRPQRREWDSVDEASDESFPASDPPARY